MCYPITTETAVKEYSFTHKIEQEDFCETIQDISKLYNHKYIDEPKNTEQAFVFETFKELDEFLMDITGGKMTPDDFYMANPSLWLFKVTRAAEIIGYIVVA